MLDAVRSHAPDARIDGFTVEPMLEWPDAQELILGIARDPTFGPVLLFGHGGIETEVVADRAIGLPPLNMLLAREMITRTRVARLLCGYRNRLPVNIDWIASVLVRLSQLAFDVPAITGLDINPLLASPTGVVAMDARVVVSAPLDKGTRFAIQPYPAELEHEIEIDGGRRLQVRPIRPEDEPGLIAMVGRCSPEDLRMRFLGMLPALKHAMAARLSQIDYDREMAFVALDIVEGLEPGPMLGVARIIGTPENDRAEFAILVRSDMKGRGIGFRLMKDLLEVARRRGVKIVHGDVLSENRTMLAMAAELGFTRETSDAGIVKIELSL